MKNKSYPKIEKDQRYGYFTYMNEYIIKYNTKHYKLKCDCGNICFLNKARFYNAKCCSYYCLLNKKNRTKLLIRHGHACAVSNNYKPTKVYTAWLNIVKFSKKKEIYIEEELITFESFLKHIKEPPSPTHRLTRINKEEGFTRDNLKWMLQISKIFKDL